MNQGERDILFLAHVHYPDEARVRREVATLLEAGYKVDLLCLGKPGEPGFEDRGNLRLLRLPLPKTRKSVRRYLWEYSSFVLGASFLTSVLAIRCRYRLVQIYNQPDFLVFAAFLPKLLNARLVFDYRDAMPEGTIDKYALSPSHKIVRLLQWTERVSMEFCDRIITVHQPFKDVLVSRGFSPSSIGIFMNLPDPKLFDRSRYPGPAAPSDEFRLMHHGTLNEVYNVGLILEALALVKQKRPDLRVSLTIYGTGPDLPRLETLARRLQLENVHFQGRVPFEDIPKLIAEGADAGVVPTRGGPVGDYSLSNKLLEYAMMGKPVIASRLPTIRSVFSDTSLLLFEPSNAEDLADSIIRLANDAELRYRLVRSADADLERFAWDSNQRRYLAFIQDALAGRAGESPDGV